MKQLPTLKDLHSDPETAFKNDQFKTLLNQPPHASWLKKHPMAKKKVNGQFVAAEYLPIDKYEFLLDVIFQDWKIEILNVSLLLNSVCVTVRVHYRNPTTGEWSYHDGIGAKSVQVDQGAAPANLGAIKDAAIQMAAPSAKSYAIKDACEHLGALFGRNINREGAIMFSGKYGEDEPQTAPQPQATPTPQEETKKDFSVDDFFSSL